MPSSNSTPQPPVPRPSESGTASGFQLDAEAKYRKLYENMIDAFVSVAMDGRITEANPAYRNLVGYTLDELSELTYIDLTPAKWHEMESRIVAEQIIARGHSEIYEKEYRRKDGSIVPVELHAFLLRDAAGRPVAMNAVVRDISERKRLEEALSESNALLEMRVAERTAELRESEARFRQLAEASYEGIAVLRDGVIINANAQIAAMLGCEPEALIGRRAGEFVAPQSRELVAENIRAGYEGTYEFYTQRCDGTVFPAEGRGRMVSADGQRLRISVLHDLTDARRMEAELAVQREKLARAQRQAMLSEIGAGIAHQIAQPLCAVRNNVAAAKSAVGQCKTQSCGALGIIQDIDHDIRRMGSIAERLRLLAHPERSRREPVVLNDLVAKVLRFVDFGEEPRRIDISTSLREDLPTIRIDPVQISQVILNLLQNAIDALASCERPERKITIVTRMPESGFVELSIGDNGPGIDPGDLPQIFELFFTTKDEGAGIGLPVSQRIVSAHGGRIEAANNNGAPGAIFRVILPTENPQP